MGWTEYCCARYDSVALCVRLLPQALIFPKQLYEAVFEEELTTIKIFVRLYGATLLSKLGKQNALTQCVDIVPDVLTVNAARYTRTFPCLRYTCKSMGFSDNGMVLLTLCAVPQ